MKPFIKKLKRFYWIIKSLGARCYYGQPAKKLKIVGVTGTSGKTTTVTLLYKIALGLGYKAGLISTVENLINGEKLGVNDVGPGTTPDSMALTKIFKKMTDAKCEYVFMEVSSHAVAQRRVAYIDFIGGIFTNFSQDHLDYHKDMEDYFQAKKGFFKMLSSKAFALANIDDVRGEDMLQGIQAKKYTYGFKNKSDFSDKLETKLLGDFNMYNVLAAYATFVILGMEKEKIKKVVKNVKPPKGRFEHFTSSNGVLVVVDYAHKPDALEKIFTAVKLLKPADGKLISVFGCGGDRDPFKRPIMGKIGAMNSDVAIFTSDNPRSEDPNKIIEQMKTSLSSLDLEKVKTIPNRHEAILEAVKIAQKGDIILCAGKGHEDYQIIKGIKTHFDDVEEFQKAFEQK